MDFKYQAKPRNPKATLGVIALSTDETLEPDLHQIFGAHGLGSKIALHISRIAMGEDNTPAHLQNMQQNIKASAALFPRSVEFDVIAYGCTSASALMGSKAVDQEIKKGARTRQTTDPFRALIAACQKLKLQKLALLSPYGCATSEAFLDALQNAGIAIKAYGSFNEKQESKVPEIDPESIFEATISLAAQTECDGIFLSCTNLRTLPIIKRIEAQTGKIVLSSNQLLAWHMAQLAGLDLHAPDLGHLWR